MNLSLNCNGRLLDLSTPILMGITNITPDSFFDGGNLSSEKSILEHVGSLIRNGATIIDIGGQSTRPGAELINENDEWNRIKNTLKLITKEFPEVIISVDTFYSSVAERSADAGASIINDISGGSMDKKMFATMAALKLPYVLMHIQGTPETMQKDPKYKNVVREVWDYFDKKISELKETGVKEIILDPGFGFGKSVEHNFSLLKNLHAFHNFRLPILAGLSRKSMINRPLKIKAENALNGTTVLNTIALMKKASILRVHDVIEAKQVITLLSEYNNVE